MDIPVTTPKALNLDNPVQAEGAARGREKRYPQQNSVGLQPLSVSCCAPTEHRVSSLHHLTPRYARSYPHFTPTAWCRDSEKRTSNNEKSITYKFLFT